MRIGEFMGIEELRKKRKMVKANTDITLDNMTKIIEESCRVAEVAGNSKQILENLDTEFERQVGLKGTDIGFLFWAIGLQLVRIALINYLTKIEGANKGCKEKELDKFMVKLLGRIDNNVLENEKPYYASLNHILKKIDVPYDANQYLTAESIKNILLKNKQWSYDIKEYVTDNLFLFRGGNHRFATLGHDPILGLVFGTVNIMTNTITCVNKPLIAENIGVPVLTTNHVIYTSEYTNPRIGAYASTITMLKYALARIGDQPEALVASLIKQIIHMGTDMYTPCGIQIPGENLLLTNKNVEKITKYISTGDFVKIGISLEWSNFINIIIGVFYLLLCNPNEYPDQELYNIKMRKIILYANLIATSSNVIWVGANMVNGNRKTIKALDINGLVIILKRLLSDTLYVRQIKDEFVFGKFNRMIQGTSNEL